MNGGETAFEYQATITKPRAADGDWHWQLERRPIPTGPAPTQWAIVKPINKDHPASGNASHRMGAVSAANEAKSFYARQEEHEKLPQREQVAL